MYSKFNSYFKSSASLPRQSSFYDTSALTSEESDYYGSRYGSSTRRSNAPLRFIIIRHGERVDITFGAGWTQYAFNYTGQYYPFAANMPPALPFRQNWLDFDVDTPLTANGLQQSWNVGTVLAGSNLPITACYSSPAFRSIQTADGILQGMGRKAQTPIRLELGLFECSSWYAQSPINFMSDEELLHGGFNIDTHYRPQIKSLRAFENEYQYYDRSKETMKKLVKLHGKTGGNILLVAHAPALEVLTRHLMGGQPRPERLAELSGKVDYCSMTIVEGNPSTKNWQFRYSLDDQTNMLNHSATQSLAYQPSPALFLL